MTTPTTDLLTYDRTLGLSVMEGRGFYYPADTVIGDNGRLYVVNRSLESVDRGVRVTVCDLESEYYGTFGAYGEGEGQFVWLTSGAKNSARRHLPHRRIPAPRNRIRRRRQLHPRLGNARQRRRRTRRTLRHRSRPRRQHPCQRHLQQPRPEVHGGRRAYRVIGRRRPVHALGHHSRARAAKSM